MTFGSLFAGIGGFDLGFERAGMTCKWQVEINDFCRRVLAKHWPDVRRHDDVKTFPPAQSEEWKVDVICGGFPCQDISSAGKMAGIDGERSKLWSEYLRIVRHLQPSFVVVENVAALLVRGMDRVLGELAEIGYDAEWHCIPASCFGAPHGRDRVFAMAYPHEVGLHSGQVLSEFLPQATVAEHRSGVWRGQRVVIPDGPHKDRFRLVPDGGIRGVAYGVPEWVDRIAGLGNAVVPQVAEWIGRRLMALENYQ